MNVTPFRVVPEHVARNPVAQAIERNNLLKAIASFQTRLYLLDENEPAQDDAQTAARVLAVAIRCCELDKTDQEPPCRVMRGALSALVSCAQRGFTWRKVDAPAIDTGLEYALEVMRITSATIKRCAWLDVERMERAA